MRLTVAVLSSLLALVIYASVFAQAGGVAESDPLLLTDERDEYPLGLYFDILEDPTGDLTIEDVSSSEFDTRFIPSPDVSPNFGFTDSAFWVRLPLQNESLLNERWLLDVGFANMHYVDLFTPSPNGQGYDVRETGAMRPLESRDVASPRITFDLTVPVQSRQTVYLRFESGASMSLPLTLWRPDAFLIESQAEHLVFGLYFGALMALLLYNLFVFFSLRDVSYLYLVLALTGVIAFDAAYSGYLDLYLLPSLNEFKTIYLSLSFALIFIPIVLFADAFLQLKRQAPKLHLLNIAILVIWGVLVLLVPFRGYQQSAILMAPFGLLSLVAVTVAGVVTWRRGFRQARFFIIAWFGLAVTVALVVVMRLGLIPSTIFTENAFRVGYIWMAVCWSLALADRINLLRTEAESAHRDLQISERRLAQILEGLPLGVVVYGTDQKPSYVNQRVVEILSNPEQDIRPDISDSRTLAQAMEYFSFRVTGSDQAYPLEELPVYRALHGEPASADDIEADLLDRRVPLEIWASPIRNDDGNVESAVVAFQDITGRKQAEAELDEYRQHLELLVGKRTADLRAINKWLDALNKSHQTIWGMEDVPQAFRELTSTITQLFDSTTMFILYWPETGATPELFDIPYQNGSASSPGQRLRPLFQKGAALRQDIELGKSVRLSANQEMPPPTLLVELFQDTDYRSLILTPMSIRHEVVGVLGIATSGLVLELDQTGGDLLDRIAHDMAELVHNARLLDQAHALAAVEERNHLARDLHDSVTQILFSASLVAEVLPQIWRRDPDLAMQSMAELRQLTRGALAEMRTMLLELRPTAVINTPLPELLSQLTEAITSRGKLSFQLFLQQIPTLPADVHVAYYRIAQEALNNVVKHAKASRVTVSLSATPTTTVSGELPFEVKLVVEDDGVGFSPAQSGSEHLGFGIMQERAEAIRAHLSMVSEPGHGTRVTLVWHREIEN